MLPNYYDRGYMAQSHRKDLLREAEHEWMLSQLPQGHFLDAPLRLIMSLRALRIRMGKGLRRRIA